MSFTRPGCWREGEVQARPFCPCPRSGSLGWCRVGIGGPGGVEALGGLTSGGCLGGVVLSFAEVGDDFEAVRLTGSVISELIHDCRESLLIVSFAAFGVTEVVHELARAVRRGVRIDLVLETTAEEGGALRGPVGAAAAFEAIRQDATFWTWPATRRPAIGASRAALHAKLVAADGRIALLGSANLTDKALALNLELGVIIHDSEVVRRMVRRFRSLMRPGVGVLQSLPRQHMDPAT